MEDIELPFKIGEQYEKWEFNLEPKDEDLNSEKYLYLGEISFLGIVPISIELQFDLDVLIGVKLYFKKYNLLEIEKLKVAMQDSHLSSSEWCILECNELIVLKYGASKFIN